MLGNLLALVAQNLSMGTPRPAATSGVNFVKLSTTLSGAITPVLFGYAPGSAFAAAVAGGGSVVDKFAVDLSAAGHLRNGGFTLLLSPSTPVTVDLWATTSGAPATAGDTGFVTVQELIFVNSGLQDVTLSPGATNPFNGPLSGGSPSFTVPAGSRLRWHNPAGWPVTAVSRNLKFDPGAAAAAITVSVGGT